MLIKDGKEYANILHTGIHALAIKGHHSMSSIANNDTRRSVMVGFAFEADEREVGIFLKRCDQALAGDQIGHTRKMSIKEGGQAGRVALQLAKLLAR